MDFSSLFTGALRAVPLARQTLWSFPRSGHEHGGIQLTFQPPYPVLRQDPQSSNQGTRSRREERGHFSLTLSQTLMM